MWSPSGSPFCLFSCFLYDISFVFGIIYIIMFRRICAELLISTENCPPPLDKKRKYEAKYSLNFSIARNAI